jgi:lysozyme family protein
MSPVERDDIYRRMYWDLIKGDDIALSSDRMAMCVFDTAVNSGVGTASRLLQRTVQAEVDGIIGRVTVSCFRIRLMRLGPTQVLSIYLERRAGLYKAILLRDRTQLVFRKGWRNRINALATVVGIEPVWED